MGILRIRDINKGMAIKQGDETPLNFELYDANGDPLSLASTGKVYFKRNSDIYHEQDVSISNKIATFTLSTILPPGNYFLEFHVSKQIFPSEDREVFKITSSALGEDITVIQINGIERVAQRALDLIEDDLDAIHQAESERELAELDRQAQEEARETAEGERETTFASYGPTLDAKADKSYVDTELAKKANKKQEEWITPTLLNGAISDSNNPVKYMKDEMGFVHFAGMIKPTTGGLVSLSVPSAYCFSVEQSTTKKYVASTSTARSIADVQINYVGNCYINAPSSDVWVRLDGIYYKAGD